jgi:ketosteroid isomerase-like protein
VTEESHFAELEIRDLERQRYEAVLNEDFEAFARLCHDKLVYTHSGGDRDSLQSYVAKCRQGKYRYHHIEHPVEDIIVVGDVAMVVGKMRAKLTVNGTEKELDNSALAVWVRDVQGWKLLAYQPTPSKQPPGTGNRFFGSAPGSEGHEYPGGSPNFPDRAQP